MSIKAVSWVLHESMSTGNDRLVLIAIADEADDGGGNAFPSMRLIAEKARIDRSTACRAVNRLEHGGELLVRRPATKGRGRFNRYVLVMGRNPEVLAGQIGWPSPDLENPPEEWWQNASSDGSMGTTGQAAPGAANVGANCGHSETEASASKVPVDKPGEGTVSATYAHFQRQREQFLKAKEGNPSPPPPGWRQNRD